MILKKLDNLSLVNCRLVSQSWNKTASSLLKKRPIWIRRAWDSEIFGELYRCVERSTNFPFSRLDLSITGNRLANLDLDNATKLFTRFGRTFTHLRAKCMMKWHKEMMKNLLKKTAQLQYLDLRKLPMYARTENPEFSLSSLRVLKFGRFYVGRDEHVLEQLIRGAPNLKEIYNVHCNSAVHMKAVRTTWKFDLVSSMTVTDGLETRMSPGFMANPPQLTALTAEVKERTVPHFLLTVKALLAQSARTLKKLEVCHLGQQLDDLPVFHNLEEILFKIDTDPSRQNAPMAAVFSHLSSSSFPKLKKIRLDTMDAEITTTIISDHFWEVSETPLETVDKLELESYCGPAVVEYLAQCFPRVTNIAVNYQQSKYGKVTRRESNIWLLHNFSNLSKLHVSDHPFKHGIMDSFLTGIPNEIVAKLRSAPKQVLTPCMSEILRTNGNMLQLKNLKEFTVTIIPSSSASKPTEENPFMTMVSIWYALEQIPGLRANFLYCTKSFKCIVEHSEDFQKAFQNVKDYVTIGRCFCDTD